MRRNGTLRKMGLLAATLCGFLILGGAASAQAQGRDGKCRQRIHRAEEKLEREIYRHGPNSRQTQRRRHDLEEARERCRRENHRDYDRDDRPGHDR